MRVCVFECVCVINIIKKYIQAFSTTVSYRCVCVCICVLKQLPRPLGASGAWTFESLSEHNSIAGAIYIDALLITH